MFKPASLQETGLQVQRSHGVVTMPTQKLLEKMRVLDIGHYVAGPFCAKVLGAFGAEVLKVEKPRVGDPSRTSGPFLERGPISEKSALFFYLNTGKMSITLDLKQTRGKKIFGELVKQADVVIENFNPDIMKRLGLDFEALIQINPRLVLTSISNFGATGLYRNWKSSELVSFALGGLSYSSYGAPGKQMLRPYGSIAQHMTGLLAATGSLTAYYGQLQGGQGQHVDVSIMECLASLEEHSIPMAAYRNEVRKRADRHPTNHPNITLPCKDGYMHVTTSGTNQWRNLCLIAGFPEEWSAEDSPFLDGLYRRQHSQEIDRYLLPWLMNHTKRELQELGWEVLLPFAPITTIPELLKDPQYQARDFMITAETFYGEKVTFPRTPCVPREGTEMPCRAPLLGEHNEEVYCNRLGYSRADLVRLRQLGVI
jgi:CoA:oxalate CoA-transferase